MNQKIKVTSLNDQVSNGDLEIVDLSFNTRLKSALKLSSILMALAIVTAFIPVLHFVLVPGFFVASIVAFVMTFTVTKKISQGHAQCPKCSTDFNVVGQHPKFPIRLVCRQCNETSYIEPAN